MEAEMKSPGAGRTATEALIKQATFDTSDNSVSFEMWQSTPAIMRLCKHHALKPSTAAVYAAQNRMGGAHG